LLRANHTLAVAARPDFRAWLRGKIAFIAMARPDVGARLLAEYRALEPD